MPDTTIQVTISDVEQKLGYTYAQAQAFITFLVAANAAKLVGVRKTPGQKGKGSNLYEIDPRTATNNIAVVFGKLLV